MGLFDAFKKQLLKVIEWTDPTGNTLVHKFDMQDREIMMGSSLTVRESQVAIFVNKGQIADIFQPGNYKLTTDNMPILTKLMSWKYGFDSPFKAEVYYVNTKQFTDQKWGTMNPIMMRDAEFGMVRIRGYGKYSFKVDDPAVFLKELFGTNSTFETEDIQNYLKSILIEGISDTIAEQKLSALDLAANYREISQKVKEQIDPEFKKIGLTLANVVMENISLPPEVEKMMDTRTSLGVMGDKMGTFMQYQAAHAMRDAAQNQGNGMAGAGMGLGAGVTIGQIYADTMKSATAAPAASSGPAAPAAVPGAVCPKCGASVNANAKFCPACGEKLAVKASCPKCGAEVPAGSKFCPECGEKLGDLKCRKCGHELKPGAKFCPECGEKQ